MLTVDDFDAALALYRDALGLEERFAWEAEDGRVVILEAGVATLELADAAQAAKIDDLEVGSRVAGPVRIALEVADSEAAAEAAGRGRRRARRRPGRHPVAASQRAPARTRRDAADVVHAARRAAGGPGQLARQGALTTICGGNVPSFEE